MTLETYCQQHDECESQAKRNLIIKEALKRLCDVDRQIFKMHVIRFNNFKNEEYENLLGQNKR